MPTAPPRDLTILTTVEVLARVPQDPCTVNPARVYHDAKAPGSRPAIRSVLKRIASWLTGRTAATWEQVCALPWWDVRARHVSMIRVRLVESAKPRTVNRDLSILRGVLETAWRNEQMPDEAYHRAVSEKGVDPDHTAAGRALSPVEVEALLGGATKIRGRRGPLAAAVIATMYAAGLRRIEVVRLGMGDVDVEAGELSVLGKRGKRRKAFLAAEWMRYVVAWKETRGDGAGPFFCHPDGSGYEVKSIAAAVEAARALGGVEPFTPHDLRRSFGTRLLDAGKDLSLVQKLMGHADVRTTIIYDRRGEKEERAAVLDVMRLSPEQAQGRDASLARDVCRRVRAPRTNDRDK